MIGSDSQMTARGTNLCSVHVMHENRPHRVLATWGDTDHSIIGLDGGEIKGIDHSVPNPRDLTTLSARASHNPRIGL